MDEIGLSQALELAHVVRPQAVELFGVWAGHWRVLTDSPDGRYHLALDMHRQVAAFGHGVSRAALHGPDGVCYYRADTAGSFHPCTLDEYLEDPRPPKRRRSAGNPVPALFTQSHWGRPPPHRCGAGGVTRLKSLVMLIIAAAFTNEMLFLSTGWILAGRDFAEAWLMTDTIPDSFRSITTFLLITAVPGTIIAGANWPPAGGGGNPNVPCPPHRHHRRIGLGRPAVPVGSLVQQAEPSGGVQPPPGHPRNWRPSCASPWGPWPSPPPWPDSPCPGCCSPESSCSSWRR